MKIKLERILQPFPLICKKLQNGTYIDEKDEILNSLANMSRALYEGANWPCREYLNTMSLLAGFYHVSGNNSKMQRIIEPDVKGFSK